MKGTESPSEIEADNLLMETVEKIRGRAAVIFGLCDKAEDAAKKSPYNPFFAIVSPPAGYLALNGQSVKAEETDLVSRLLFMLKMHKAYPITGTVATGIAAKIPGSVVWKTLREEAREGIQVNIGHPSGVIPVEADVTADENGIRLNRVAVYRTARRIMDGVVYVKNGVSDPGNASEL